VFKRSLEKTYILKSKRSRAFFKTVTNEHPTFLFSIGQFKDPIVPKTILFPPNPISSKQKWVFPKA
jgi:hypothetical protein